MSAQDNDNEMAEFVGEPPWLKHLTPEWQAWREKQILKGRDPDPHIKNKLIEAGVLPAEDRADGEGE